MGEIDPAFIQETEYRPIFKTIEADEEIPLIDLSVSTPSDTERSCVKDWRSEQEVGIFSSDQSWGAVGTKAKDREDPTLIPASDDPDDKELRVLTNQWPHKPSELRELCQEYTRQVEKLAFKLLELISLSLGLPADRLNGYFKDQISFARFNHYPPCPAPHLALGVGRHKDGGALTILSQDDVGGLQIGRRSDGEWIPVKPIPDAFIINIGNCMQVWSNDLYWSAEHRVVVNSQRERLSIPFFFFPSHYVDIKPLDELINEQNPAKYKEFNWGKFFASRNRSDYKKREGENIQIDHFKASE
ncbi:hypothetical protein OIU77_028892 [Salix suchowensis]|uniref:Fe2OG dioxygenase domain-containing protein n=1 Tax=Salix suchowensis TaxID=1278906 RepID=A0ABQ9BLA8_9ROSI|nr:hypothetical protein OIU77_028892 [Salix suchowensis]